MVAGTFCLALYRDLLLENDTAKKVYDINLIF
jgi:hypothetical protein